MLCARRGVSWNVKQLHAVAELTEGCSGGRTREPAAHDDDLEATLVGRVHQLHVELVVRPLLRDRTLGDPGVELTDHLVTTPVVMSSGMLTLPTVMTTANAIAK